MIDWIASGFTFINVWLIGDKNTYGWYFGMVGNVLWMWYSVLTGQTPLFVLNLSFFALNVKGLYQWSTDDEFPEES